MISKKAFDLDAVKLSTTVTIGQYLHMEKDRNVGGIAKFLQQRLSERYITPLVVNPKKNGFLIMASSCLLIETMEAFRKGWSNTDKCILPTPTDLRHPPQETRSNVAE